MDDVVVVEASDDVNDGVALADVGEKLVTEAGAVRGSLDETGDVDELDGGWDDVVRLGAGDGGESLEALVGDRDDAAVGLDGAERVVGSLRGAVLDQSIEQGGLADVGQADDAGVQRHGGDRGGAESALRARGGGEGPAGEGAGPCAEGRGAGSARDEPGGVHGHGRHGQGTDDGS